MSERIVATFMCGGRIIDVPAAWRDDTKPFCVVWHRGSDTLRRPWIPGVGKAPCVAGCPCPKEAERTYHETESDTFITCLSQWEDE